jgi:hypothetical protein
MGRRTEGGWVQTLIGTLVLASVAIPPLAAAIAGIRASWRDRS